MINPKILIGNKYRNKRGMVFRVVGYDVYAEPFDESSYLQLENVQQPGHTWSWAPYKNVTKHMELISV